MVTSSVAGEGKTTVATNLALSMAQTGMRTLLIETDLRKPRVSKSLGIPRTPGLTDYILNREPLDGCIRDMSDLLMGSLSHNAMKEDAIPGIEYLNILPAGKIERNPSEIIAGKKMDSLIEILKERYDIIIFDSAPVIQATDSVVLASKVETNLIVYYQGKISRNTLRRAKNQLELLKSSVLGVVINGMRADISADYVDYRYKYDYLYSYGESHEADESTTILGRTKSIFLRRQSNAHLTFLQRLKKAPIILFCMVAMLIIIGAIFTSRQQKLQVVQPQEKVETPANHPIKQDTIKAEVPAKLKELQKQYQIEKSENIKTPVKVPIPTPSTKYEEVKKEDTVIELGLNQPYTIQIDRISNRAKASNRVQKLREFGLSAFLTPDYSIEKNYLVCIDNFRNRPQAESAITQLQFADISGNFKVLYLPYSIKMESAKFTKNNFYSYKYHVNGSNYYFAGSFKNISTANLFRKNEIIFSECPIVKR